MPASLRPRVFLLAILLAAVCLPASVGADDDFSPPLEGIVRYGCEAFLADKAWHLRVWAEHRDKGQDWTAIRSVHEGKNARAKCLRDCDAWMRQVDQKLKAKNARIPR